MSSRDQTLESVMEVPLDEGHSIDRVGGRIDCMAVEPTFEKASWTIPSDVLEAVRRNAPRGKVSAYVAEALRRQLELDDLAALVGEIEETSGPFDDEVVARYADEMR